MRFCPFCAQETSDDAGRCVHCGRRLSARTTQQAAIAQPGPKAPPAPPIKPTMLGLGPATTPSGVDAEVGGGGPTTIGGPTGLGAEADPTTLQEPASMKTPVILPGRSSGAGRRADSGLEEETRLPPPAPGLMTPNETLDPPTHPGLRGRGGSSNAAARPQGQAPVRRLAPDHPARPPSGPRPDSAAPEAIDAGADLTTPMTRIEAEALLGDALAAAPRSSQPLIPSLPPPPPALGGKAPDPPSGQTPLLVPRSATGSLLLRLPPVAMAELPVIPAAPAGSSLLAAVRYLWPVARGVYARRKEGVRIRRSLGVVQGSLDGILLRLGRVAFEERLQAPHISEEMVLVGQADDRRGYALGQNTQLVTVRRTEEQRRSAQEADLQQAIDTLSREAERLDGELRKQAAERQRTQAELSRIDADLRRLLRAAEQADARAQGAAGPASSQARALGDSARGQAEALRPQRDTRAKVAEELEAPIAELTQQLAVARSELGLRRQELLRHRAEKQKLLAALDADMARSQAEQEAAEREMQQRMMTVGTLVNLHRESGPRYQPLYQHIDEIKAQLTAYEATLARLDTESSSYDEEAVQKGLLLLGGGGLLSGLIVAAFYLIWALSHR